MREDAAMEIIAIISISFSLLRYCLHKLHIEFLDTLIPSQTTESLGVQIELVHERDQIATLILETIETQKQGTLLDTIHNTLS